MYHGGGGGSYGSAVTLYGGGVIGSNPVAASTWNMVSPSFLSTWNMTLLHMRGQIIFHHEHGSGTHPAGVMTLNQSHGSMSSIFFSAVTACVGGKAVGPGMTVSTWKYPAVESSMWNSQPVGAPVSFSTSHQVQGSGVVAGCSTLNQSHCMMVSIFFLAVTVYDGGIWITVSGSVPSTWNMMIPSFTSTWNSKPVGAPASSSISHQVHRSGR